MLPDHPGYLVVDAYTDAKWMKFEQTVKVNTGLVSPGTAHALVRALQSYDDPYDFYLCPEGHDREIDDGEFTLKGWLRHHEMDTRLDDADIYRNGVRRIQKEPGAALTAILALEQGSPPRVAWWRTGADQPALIYEGWGKRGTRKRASPDLQRDCDHPRSPAVDPGRGSANLFDRSRTRSDCRGWR